MPLTWPFGHVSQAFGIAAQDKKDVVVPPLVASPELDIVGHLTSMAGALRSVILAYFCIFYIHGGEDGYGYPAFGSAATWSVAWMWPLLVRNLAATWLICGFWDWFLYFSPIAPKLHAFKMNPQMPTFGQIKHDAIVTTFASVCGTGVEVALCHYWANGTFSMQRSIGAAPLATLLWCLTITHWRIPHFWLIHRGMHPWKCEGIPDVGKWLYKKFHSLHHKSYNPTAFSGTNMHPVEATLYYSAALIPVPFGVHPLIPLACIIDCAVGAWLGHDGFQWPGSGDYFHQLHHANFDCNYGAMHVPIDYWLGTYAGNKADVKKIWGKKKAGAGANETAVHGQPPAAKQQADKQH